MWFIKCNFKETKALVRNTNERGGDFQKIRNCFSDVKIFEHSRPNIKPPIFFTIYQNKTKNKKEKKKIKNLFFLIQEARNSILSYKKKKKN